MLPQVIPAGLLVTVPLPVPAFTTVSVNRGMNIAVTLRACVILTVHVLVPLHPATTPAAEAGATDRRSRQRHIGARIKEGTARAATGNTRWATRHRATTRPGLHHRKRKPRNERRRDITRPRHTHRAGSVPLHPPPLQPLKRELPTGVAVRVTSTGVLEVGIRVGIGKSGGWEEGEVAIRVAKNTCPTWSSRDRNSRGDREKPCQGRIC